MDINLVNYIILIILSLLHRKLTLCDGIERCLKKGKGAEQAVAAQLAVLLCVQLGALQDCEEVSQILKPVLLQTATDKSVSAAARVKVIHKNY